MIIAIIFFIVSGLLCGLCFNRMYRKLLDENGDPQLWFFYSLCFALILGCTILYLSEVL